MGTTLINRQCREKYPIGTKIRFTGSKIICVSSDSPSYKDIGKIGKIVGYCSDNYPIIFLPESTHISDYSTQSMPATWQTGWHCIEILPQKNQQLLFDFALEGI